MRRIFYITLCFMIILPLTLMVSSSGKKGIEKSKAKVMYDKYQDSFSISWQDAEFEMDINAPEDVLFAASAEKEFGKKREDTYKLLNEGKTQEELAGLWYKEKYGITIEEADNKKENTIEDAQKSAESFTKEDLVKLKEEYDKAHKDDKK